MSSTPASQGPEADLVIEPKGAGTAKDAAPTDQSALSVAPNAAGSVKEKTSLRSQEPPSERKASLKSQDPVAPKEVAEVKGSAERKASLKSQDPVAPKEVAEVKGSAERKASLKSQDPVAPKQAAASYLQRQLYPTLSSAEDAMGSAQKEAGEVKAIAERKASLKSQDVAVQEMKEAERKEEDELRSLLAAAEQKLKACQQELEVEQQAASDESIVVASLLAQLTAEKRRGVAAESEAQGRHLETQRAEAETRVELEAAKQLRLEAFTAAQEAHHLKSESSEAAYVLSECKAALERHDAEEKRDSEFAEENKELEAALKVEATIVEELRELCSSEAKCCSVAMGECDSLRRELHDLTRLSSSPAPAVTATPQGSQGYPRSRPNETHGIPRRSTGR